MASGHTLLAYPEAPESHPHKRPLNHRELLGLKLEKFRRDLRPRLSRRELAERVKLNRHTIAGLEHGTTAANPITLEQFLDILQIIGCKAEIEVSKDCDTYATTTLEILFRHSARFILTKTRHRA